MSSRKTIFIDIDGTICTEERTFERPLAQPLPGAIEGVNRIYEAGHTVILWTARGWEQFLMTQDWLNRYGFRYHQLLMGKPIGTLFIDDRARQFVGWDQDYVGP